MTVPSTPAALPAVGAPAPEFSLPSTLGGEVDLASFRGARHVLLAFFPLAFTSTCTAELCALSDDVDHFAGSGAVVLPISVDSVPTLKEYKAKHGLRVDLLSDFKRRVAHVYGVLDADRFRARRSYFLIDRTGVLRWRHVEAHDGLRRDEAELLSQIEALG